MGLSKKQKNLLSAASLLLIFVFVIIANNAFGSFSLRIFNLCGIYIILALSLNLINGFTGMFSLGTPALWLWGHTPARF